VVQLVQSLGFEVEPEEVFSSMSAARKLVCERQLRPFLLLHPRALSDFEGVPVEEPNAVLVGLACEAFSYENMNRYGEQPALSAAPAAAPAGIVEQPTWICRAFRILLQPEAELIAIHKGRYFKEADGLSLGPGPFVAALEFATGKTAAVVGKPEASFFLAACSDLGLSPSECVMIGGSPPADSTGHAALPACTVSAAALDCWGVRPAQP
jgi:ribonucleotide monophosphatase NagD (HAD superfamily)